MADTLIGTHHCDDYIDNPSAPSVLRWYLFINRLPAVEKILALEFIDEPVLFADFIAPNNQGRTKTVRIVMASRFGDVGITERLDRSTGYSKRVAIDELTNFRDNLSK